MATPAIRLSIAGMTCAGCISAVESALSSVSGVEQANVNLAERTAMVQGDVDPESLKKAVQEAGFDAAVMQGKSSEIEKEAHEKAQLKQLWKRVWVASIPGAALFISGMVLGVLPEVDGLGRLFWLVVAVAIVQL